MSFVHCNHCFAHFGEKQKFFLGSCKHIYCQECVEQVKAQGRCCTCHANCKIMEINRKMHPEIKQLFKDPSHVVAEFRRLVTEVTTYERAQTATLQSHVKQQEKLANAMKHAEQLAKEKKAIEDELIPMRNAIARNGNFR